MPHYPTQTSFYYQLSFLKKMEFNSPSIDYELPSYSSSSPVPAYSCELGLGERSLQQTPQSRGSRPPLSSLFIKGAGKTTITLEGQEQDATTPTYSRNATICGNVLLEKSETVLSVVLKIEGKLDAITSNTGAESIKLCADTYTLWSHTTSPGSTCPSQIPFSVLMPFTFHHKNQNVPLPPSHNEAFYDVPSLFVRSGYQIHFVVSRLRHQKVGNVWPKTKHILVPFKYVPRIRPNRPIIYTDCFFSSIKSLPEEWFQAVSDLKMRPTRTNAIQLAPVCAHLFVPSSRIYGVADKIPFHVQLSGDVSTLREFFSGAMLDRVVSADSHNTVEVPPTKRSSTKRPLINVSLLRQVAVSLQNGSAWKNTVLAEGSITPVPPSSMSWYESPDDLTTTHIDWEGELFVDQKPVSGFTAAHVQIKDFICLTLSPPSSTSLLQLQITIPIRLVTDSFTEVAGLDMASER